MSDERISQVFAEDGEVVANINEHPSIGLTNINSRIKLFYGEEYQLVIQSKLSKGTTVQITLPLAREENPDD